jgi:hypothetical protein
MTMNGRNLLLLLVGDASPRQLRDAVAARALPPTRVHVVAPTLVGPLDWLASAEDDAHRQAEVRALDAEWTLADQAEVGGEAGDVDPVQAVEDALRAFPADEILLAGEAADPDLEAALARFGVPITRLDPASLARRSCAYRALRELAGGHRSATPFVLFVGVNTAFLLLGVLLSLLVLLILWLSGSL